jgi:hypothetical protein
MFLIALSGLRLNRFPFVSIRIKGSGFWVGKSAISWISLLACFSLFLIIDGCQQFFNSLEVLSALLRTCNKSIEGSFGKKSSNVQAFVHKFYH